LDTESWANDNLFTPINEIAQRNPEFFGRTKEKLPSRETYRLRPGENSIAKTKLCGSSGVSKYFLFNNMPLIVQELPQSYSYNQFCHTDEATAGW